MELINSKEELQTALSSILDWDGATATLRDEAQLRNTLIDRLVYTATFTEDDELKKEVQLLIRALAEYLHCAPHSIHDLYIAAGRNEVGGFTVPAMNVRTLIYDFAQTVFRLAQQHNIGPFVFEIARSEQEYTDQHPMEFVTSILAGAIKTGYNGPVFLQGDHYQFKPAKFRENREGEIERIKSIIKESVDAGFYNIDIDASTLVDLSKTDLNEQQKDNYEMTASMTEYIRSIQPEGITVSVGGEIGHIGGVNSTVADFRTFMDGYLKHLPQGMTGISKVSVQTGTSHGGTVLPDGTIADVNLDFSILKTIGECARNEYHIGGPVQHGASTLKDQYFTEFPHVYTLEIHLATEFQNIIYAHLPHDVKGEIETWIKENLANEREDGWNDGQFVYKLKKKAWGPFKQVMWDLEESEKQPILAALESKLTTYFQALNIFNTKDVVLKHIY